MIELEKTYLAKEIPAGLSECRRKEIIDIYIPKSRRHPTLRIRKNGSEFEMTKKEPVENDASHQREQTIVLTNEEFLVLNKLDGKKVRKIRYYYEHGRNVAEIDVFQDALLGLVLVDFEFDTMAEKDRFEMPEFCLADISNEEFIAGGMICGKSYEDISSDLNRFGYKKLFPD
jgi:CYTH domain-containing protein